MWLTMMTRVKMMLKMRMRFEADVVHDQLVGCVSMYRISLAHRARRDPRAKHMHTTCARRTHSDHNRRAQRSTETMPHSTQCTYCSQHTRHSIAHDTHTHSTQHTKYNTEHKAHNTQHRAQNTIEHTHTHTTSHTHHNSHHTPRTHHAHNTPRPRCGLITQWRCAHPGGGPVRFQPRGGWGAGQVHLPWEARRCRNPSG